MKRHVRNFLIARLAKVDRELAKVRLGRKTIGDWERPSVRGSYAHRENRLARIRDVILNRFHNEEDASGPA